MIIEHGTDLDLLTIGLTAGDSEDGDLSGKIRVDVTDTTVLSSGKYLITYTVTDSAGNEESVTVPLFVLAETNFFP